MSDNSHDLRVHLRKRDLDARVHHIPQSKHLPVQDEANQRAPADEQGHNEVEADKDLVVAAELPSELLQLLLCSFVHIVLYRPQAQEKLFGIIFKNLLAFEAQVQNEGHENWRIRDDTEGE